MNLTQEQSFAIRKLYSQVVNIMGNLATDANGNEVAYDLSAVEAKVAQDEADKVAQEQAAAIAKQSAIAKLSALGLTADEIAHLIP